MRLAGKRQTQKYMEQAKTWFYNHHKSWIFNDVKRIAITAVAEFIANKDNKIIYKK